MRIESEIQFAISTLSLTGKGTRRRVLFNLAKTNSASYTALNMSGKNFVSMEPQISSKIL